MYRAERIMFWPILKSFEKWFKTPSLKHKLRSYLEYCRKELFLHIRHPTRYLTSSWFHSLLMSSFVSCSTNRKFLKTTRSFRNHHEAFHPILHQKWATVSNQTQLTWNIILKSSQDQLCMPNVFNVHCTYSITNGK